MSAPAFNRFVGRLELPTEAEENATLQELDPAKDILISLFRTAIMTELGPRWASARLGTPLADRDPVESTLDVEPTPEILQQERIEFPLLAVYRDGDPESTEFTLAIDRITQRWGVDYVLGPLDAASLRRIGNALHVVAKIVQEVVQVGGHPEHGMDDSGTQPEQVLIGTDENSCRFSSVRVVNWSTGQASFATDGQGPTYWWMTLQLETTEDDGRTEPYLGMPDHEAADFSLGTGTADGIIDDLVEFESSFVEEDDEEDDEEGEGEEEGDP